VAFASGSPFPILPAHFIQVFNADGTHERSAFVDGGFTNNVPVDAAHTLGASRVLIIESSSALPSRSKPPGVIDEFLSDFVWGQLVRSAGLLPGYFYDRSQEVDRLSRRDMLVVSMSPSRDAPNWPLLFDFRTDRVAQMKTAAEADIRNRIALVESWGLPSFARHTTLPAVTSAPSAKLPDPSRRVGARTR
jgi:predicted acylesterase/phospholipase RssA